MIIFITFFNERGKSTIVNKKVTSKEYNIFSYILLNTALETGSIYTEPLLFRLQYSRT